MSDAGLPPLDFGEALQCGGDAEFWAIRGHAIQAYASLEQALCMLFATLAGVYPDVAGIIFFMTVNVVLGSPTFLDFSPNTPNRDTKYLLDFISKTHEMLS